MKTVFNSMLEDFEISGLEEAELAIKQCVQKIILCGLARGGFFNHATFYGGTALRLLYDLERYSEDLDFVLNEKNPNFNLERYFPCIVDSLIGLGLNFEIEYKPKKNFSNVITAYVKGNFRNILNTFFEDYLFDKNTHAEKVVKVKIDVATNPVDGGIYDFKFINKPAIFQVRTFNLSTIFAAKISACLFRYEGRKEHIKGRDYFDFVFLLNKKTKVNINYLKGILINEGRILVDDDFNIKILKNMLIEKFKTLNYETAKKDVEPYVDNNFVVSWSKEFFIDLTEKLTD